MIRKHRAKSGAVTYYVYVAGGKDGKKQYVGRARTKEEARELERRQTSERWQVEHGLRLPTPEGTFRQLALPWVEARGTLGPDGQPRRAAWRDDASRMKRHVLPFYGDRPIAECGKVSLLRDFLRDRESEVGGKTLLNILRLLSRFFNELPDDVREVVGNPVEKLDRADRPRSNHDPKDTLFVHAKQDIIRLIHALPSPIREIYAVSVLAGVREGEARALYVNDLDFERRTIHIQRTAKDKGQAGASKVGPVKDHESRFVPMSDDLRPLLKDYLGAVRRVPSGLESIFLFPALRARQASSGMIDPHTIEETFRAVRDELGLAKVTFYQASRHTYASHYVMDGGDIKQLQKILGHSSVAVTERYAHLLPGHFTSHDFAPRLGLAAPAGAPKPRRSRRSHRP